LRITDIQNDAVDWSSVPYCLADPGQMARNRLADGDIVFARTGATTGKSFLVRNPPTDAVFASYLIRVRPDARLDPGFLSQFFRSPNYWGQIAKAARGAAQPGVNASVLKELAIPLPTLAEQCRIATILDRADTIRRQHEHAIALSCDFLGSVFLEMFGNPEVNPKRFPKRPLMACSRFTSGGTPSKANSDFWCGEFPWVSPKDMKVETIVDAEDHLSEVVFDQTNLKRIPTGTPLIVVRGMILSHTVPMAITARDVAINQDIKGINFDDDVDPVFGYWCLKVQHNAILARVDTAAHGTKRLDSERLGEIPIIIPDAIAQRQFLTVVEKFDCTRRAMTNARQGSEAMFASLSQRAFQGEI
jgi:type I restriction enzyme S subunit